MKRFAVFVFIILSIGMTATVYASESSNIFVDACIVEFDSNTGVPFATESGRTMVPLRKAMESMGVEVTWKPENSTVVLRKDSKTLILTLNSDKIKTSDKKTITSDSVPQVINNRIYLPIRIIAEEFGAKVLWNSQLNSVYILTDKYADFRDMFVYEGELSKYADVDTVVVSATYKGKMNEDQFEKYWMGFADEEIETYLKAIATDKKSINPEYEILINFFYNSGNDKTRNPYLGSVSSYSFEARRYNPFEEKEINNLN